MPGKAVTIEGSSSLPVRNPHQREVRSWSRDPGAKHTPLMAPPALSTRDTRTLQPSIYHLPIQQHSPSLPLIRFSLLQPCSCSSYSRLPDTRPSFLSSLLSLSLFVSPFPASCLFQALYFLCFTFPLFVSSATSVSLSFRLVALSPQPAPFFYRSRFNLLSF